MVRSGLGRRTPLVTAAAIVAANAPDVDVLAYFRDEYFALAFRRGITHGIPALLIWPLVITGMLVLFDRHVRRRRRPAAAPVNPRMLLLVCASAVASHPLLDWLNNYGMRWLLPFNERWSYGDAVFIIDPWLWLLLGAAYWLSRNSTRTEQTRARMARAFGLAAIAYVLLLVLADPIEVRSARRYAERNGVAGIRDVMVAPVPGNPFGGYVVITTDEHYHTGTFRWLPRPQVSLDTSVTPIARSPLAERAARGGQLHDYLVWSRFPFFSIRSWGDGYAVHAGDARYMRGPRAGSLTGVTEFVRDSLFR